MNSKQQQNITEVIKFITFLKRNGFYEKYLNNFQKEEAHQFRLDVKEDYAIDDFLVNNSSNQTYFEYSNYWYYWLCDVNKNRFIDSAFEWAYSNEGYGFWFDVEKKWQYVYGLRKKTRGVSFF